MAQTIIGARKIAAKKVGITVAQYAAKQAKGMKWCVLCRSWHAVSMFGEDSSRRAGLVPSCKESKNQRIRARYQKKVRAPRGGRMTPPRDGDKKQARHRVNYFISAGLIP